MQRKDVIGIDNYFALSKLNWKPIRKLFEMCKDGNKWIIKIQMDRMNQTMNFFKINIMIFSRKNL